MCPRQRAAVLRRTNAIITLSLENQLLTERAEGEKEGASLYSGLRVREQ